MSGWYYIKKGMVSDSQEGPINEADFLNLAFAGELVPGIVVLHPTNTNGEWVDVSRIPAALKQYEDGKAIRDLEAERRSAEAQAKRSERIAKVKSAVSSSISVAGNAAHHVADATVAAGQMAEQAAPHIHFIIKSGFWCLSILCSILGAIVAIFLMSHAQNVMQEIEGPVIGVVIAIIPYCIARAVAELGRR